ncbi:pilus assembly protein prepilin peptidase subunit [Parvularcula bermudensis HTCC2503]|uniref:Pilus assembly protein prepilin peptidase subunit n=1 Tax=Parvularcula bermudensis (strain ATCC BAA-594 / HTCC2503 / KCTC 12087) TaxID=314260 RepID=E0TGA3_PARBH|nr:prepilin peptidase [Parvularcula bermudensis]ADM09146.1 pilus assembly protein prepilin peptidase subunit [Parvularcula bermudensis HTCC2503]
MFSSVISLVYPALLSVAAVYDLTSFKIPNRVTAALAVAWPLCALAVGIPFTMALSSVAFAFGILAAGFALFAIGKLGGGDVKLLAATTLWVGPALALEFVLWTMIFGGGLAFALLSFRRLPLPVNVMSTGWLFDLYNRKKDMPYGVAIAASGLMLWSKTPFSLF